MNQTGKHLGVRNLMPPLVVEAINAILGRYDLVLSQESSRRDVRVLLFPVPLSRDFRFN